MKNMTRVMGLAMAMLVVLAAAPALAQELEIPDWRDLGIGTASGTAQPLSLAEPVGLRGQQQQEQEISPECAALRADPSADIGVVMRAGCQPTLQQMSKLMDNPLGNVAMLFTQFDTHRLTSPSTGRDEVYINYMGIAQFPKSLGSKVNLINRIIWNVPSLPIDSGVVDEFRERWQTVPPPSGISPPGDLVPPDSLFDARTTGFGDLYYVGLFAQSEPASVKNGKLVWGLGFDLGFPTASNDLLGGRKYTAGPAVIAAYLGQKWKYGFLMTNYFSYAGAEEADDVRMTNIQYLHYFAVTPTTSVGAAPNIIIDYEQSSGNKVTLPIGIGAVQTMNFGKLPVRIGVEYMYNVITPNDIIHTQWDLRIYIIPAVASALIPFL